MGEPYTTIRIVVLMFLYIASMGPLAGCKKKASVQPAGTAASAAPAPSIAIASAPPPSGVGVPSEAPAASAESDVKEATFDVEIKIPEALVVKKEIAAGMIYSSPDKTARLTVTRGLIGNDADQSLDAKCKTLTQPMPGLSVTYSKKAGTWCVASGYMGADEAGIYYTKYLVEGDRWAQFTMFFDRDQRSTYEPLLGAIQKSFRIIVR